MVERFPSLRSIVHGKGHIDEDNMHCIKEEWQKWRDRSQMLYDKRIPIRIKVTFYYMVVRPALLYSLGVGQSRRLKSKDDCRGEKRRMIC